MGNPILDEILNYVKDVESEPLEKYVGPFTFDVINDRLIHIKKFLKENEPDRQKFKRVYSVLVEMTENVIKHSNKESEIAESAYLLYKEADRYTIYVANMVHEQDGDKIKERVDFLSHKTQEELKEIKLSQLKNGEISNRGGAGLGLIEIAMKVQGDFSCELKYMNNGERIMIMIININ